MTLAQSANMPMMTGGTGQEHFREVFMDEVGELVDGGFNDEGGVEMGEGSVNTRNGRTADRPLGVGVFILVDNGVGKVGGYCCSGSCDAGVGSVMVCRR